MTRYQRTRIWHVGKKWFAQKDSNDNLITTGKMPEEAIEQLHIAFPVLAMCEIDYDTKKSIKPVTQVDVCPVCGKKVAYYRTKKDTGRNGVIVVHDGDPIPDGDVLADDITIEYKKWLLEKAHL